MKNLCVKNGLLCAKLECEGTTTAYGLKNADNDSVIAHTVSPLGKFVAGNYATNENQNQRQNFSI